MSLNNKIFIKRVKGIATKIKAQQDQAKEKKRDDVR